MALCVENEHSRGLSIQWRSSAFCTKKKTGFTNLIENEIARLGSIKTQFCLEVRFSIVIDGDRHVMEHYFYQRDCAIFNRNNEATINDIFNCFIDEVKGEIEAWSQRGSG